MAGMKDTLGDQLYPTSPGYKKVGTSQDAARSVARRSGALKNRALDAIKNAGTAGLTADECAAVLGESVLSIRPRFSELLGAGLIRETGQRRRNASGKMADVLVAA